jgi:hypothetical protein
MVTNMPVTFLPQVHGNPDVIQGQSDNAQTFIDAWLARLGERAKLMQPDLRLMRCAQEHATWLAQRQGEEMQKSLHIGKDNSTSNQRVAASGYKLPGFWDLANNNCEACAVHHDGPVEALQLLLDSPAHRPLVLGEKVSDWFWHHHVTWGLGVTPPFYVLICAPPEGSM